MKIALAQINCTVGDLAGNAARIRAAAMRAKAAGATILLTPELALSGYPPEDLLLREDLYAQCAAALNSLLDAAQGITLVVGHPLKEGTHRYNAASVLRDGKIEAVYRKQRLPNDTVFDEVRYFTPGTQACVFEQDNVRFGVNICADVWEQGAACGAAQAGAEVLLVLNASPFHIGKQQERYHVVRERIRESGLPMVYCNLLGGQDELIFDGGSFAMNANGEITSQFPVLVEDVYLVETDGVSPLPGEIAPALSTEACVYEALKLGVRDYIGKNGFSGVLLGLSGGIDSALTLAVAVDALGADKVHAVMMPSEFTANISVEDARAMVATLGVKYSELPIKGVFDSFLSGLAGEFNNLPFDVAEENIQARIRGTLLMALSNKFGQIVLTTGNKSEMAVGYATLYGDMAGGFAVLRDVPKTLVYRLSNYRNGIAPVIPQRIIERAPSAELRANQVDQDTLPPYEMLDAIIERYVEHDQTPAEIVAAGYNEAEVIRVIRMIDRSEYKRRQAPVGIRITPRAFGKDRRYPITSRFKPG
ncbi:MAG TPA: NAD+ synthase [Sulfuriferula sp.]|nr:NAD+ synthase [Sulfuriferula sp.]